MKKLEYSPDAIEKLHEIRQDVTIRYGVETAKKVLNNIVQSIRDLQRFENKGPSVESMIGIPCDYRMLYVGHNYVFYRVEKDSIRITDIYNEKEDFMWKLFGIKTIMQESEQYWEE